MANPSQQSAYARNEAYKTLKIKRKSRTCHEVSKITKLGYNRITKAINLLYIDGYLSRGDMDEKKRYKWNTTDKPRVQEDQGDLGQVIEVEQGWLNKRWIA